MNFKVIRKKKVWFYGRGRLDQAETDASFAAADDVESVLGWSVLMYFTIIQRCALVTWEA